MKWMSMLTIVFSAAVMIAGQEETSTKRTSGNAVESQDKNIATEEAEAADAKERDARRAKNVRYNAGRTDLTKRDPKIEGFVEQVWPRRDLIPAAESAVIATGRVVKVQPYLSADRSRIYTEITIRADELLKQDRASRISVDKTLVIDRLGGVLRLRTGQVVRDDVQIGNLGITQLGKRYVLFARSVNDGTDISLMGSYELVDCKVFTNDSRPRRLISTLPGVPSTWADEAAFLKAVREVTVSTARNGKRRQRFN
jgi:hypothetical protein